MNSLGVKRDVERLSRNCLCDEVTRIIKSRIFENQYKRGSRLLVEDIANSISVSVTPVREGLKNLVLEGLVSYENNRYFVFDPTDKEIEDIFAIRRALECLAVYTAADNFTEESTLQFRKMLSMEMVNFYTTHISKFIENDKIFHERIIDYADNNRLKSILVSYSEQCWLIRSWGFSHVFSREYVEDTIKEHDLIIDALLRRDSQRAVNAMNSHLISGEARTWEALAQSRLSTSDKKTASR